MKKITIFLIVAVCTTFAAKAQEYKPFRVGVGAGYASPSGSGAKAGVLFYIEPGYRVSDMLLVNLRMEWAVVASGSADNFNSSASVDASALGSYTVNGQYYFMNGNFRPFAGAGFGLYSITSGGASVSGSGSTSSAAKDSKIGFYPRIGFDASHFTFSIDYNIIGETSADYIVSSGSGTTTQEVKFKNSYIGFRIGGFFGGGKK